MKNDVIRCWPSKSVGYFPELVSHIRRRIVWRLWSRNFEVNSYIGQSFFLKLPSSANSRKVLSEEVSPLMIDSKSTLYPFGGPNELTLDGW